MMTIVQMDNNLIFLNRKRQKGALMMEVLVSLFFVVTVFMGVLGSQVFMQKSTAEVSQRTQAISIMNSMVNRMMSNRRASGCYNITDTTGVSPYLGVGGFSPGMCGGFGDAETQAVAGDDLQDWSDQLVGSSGVDGDGNQIKNLKNAKGCISFDDTTIPPVITVAIAWEGSSEQLAPLSNCGKGAYSSESVRRAVQTKVQIGILSS
jgi:type IV pilus assembly protein PilV